MWEIPGIQAFALRMGLELLVGSALFAALFTGKRWARQLTLFVLGLGVLESIAALGGPSDFAIVRGALYGAAFVVLRSKDVNAYLETKGQH
jgi:hypothetical protein